MSDPRSFHDHHDERSYGPEVCPCCGEDANGVFTLEGREGVDWIESPAIRCRPCWESAWEYGRRHVAEAWECEDGSPIPDPVLVRVPR